MYTPFKQLVPGVDVHHSCCCALLAQSLIIRQHNFQENKFEVIAWNRKHNQSSHLNVEGNGTDYGLHLRGMNCRWKGFPGVCTVSTCHHKQIRKAAGVNLRSELESALNGLELLTALDRA